MRKSAFLTLILGLAFSFSAALSPAHADDDAAPVKKAAQNLVNLEGAHNEDRIRDLERRIDDMEREKRFQDERIRNLERTVNDLRRER